MPPSQLQISNQTIRGVEGRGVDLPLSNVCEGDSATFCVDNGSYKNLILAKVIKILKLMTTPHPQPYAIG